MAAHYDVPRQRRHHCENKNDAAFELPQNHIIMVID